MRSKLRDTGGPLSALTAETLQLLSIFSNGSKPLTNDRRGCIVCLVLLIIVIEHTCTCIENLSRCMGFFVLHFCRVWPI